MLDWRIWDMLSKMRIVGDGYENQIKALPDVSLPNIEESSVLKTKKAFTTKEQSKSALTETVQIEHIVPEEDIEIPVDKQSPHKNKQETKGECQLTPRKRVNPVDRADTPAKRRCVRFENAAALPERIMDENVPTETVINERNEAEQHILELEPLQSSVFQIHGRSKKRIFTDTSTMLTNNVIRAWIGNVQCHTKIQDRVSSISIPSAAILLKSPATSMTTIRGRQWCQKLYSHFKACTTGPSIQETETIMDTLMNAELVTSKEFTRADDASNILKDVEPEISDTVNIITDTNELLITSRGKISEVTTDFIPEAEATNIIEQNGKSSITIHLPEITADATVNEENIRTQPNVLMTKNELIATLEVFWNDKDSVQFDELIPPSNYTKKDAVRAFVLLLELHNDKKIILKQLNTYDTIWIKKYPAL